MNTLDDLLRFILRHDHVIVFGNLGRYPKLVFDALVADPQLEVVISSPYYACPSGGRIHAQETNTLIDSCDLFISMEPVPYQMIEKPPKAARMVVFTSHFNFMTRPESVWSFVSYFHDPQDVQSLLKIQDVSIQTRSLLHVQVDAVHKVSVQGKSEVGVEHPDTYVLIDLTPYSHPFTMYLAFWDAFDFMQTHKDFIRGWRICFPEKQGKTAFYQFAQSTLDQLLCHPFHHGNVTDVRKIVSMLPYYTSGSIEKEFNVSKAKFMDVEYIAPSDPLDICKASTYYNLEHWVDNIYRIKN